MEFAARTKAPGRKFVRDENNGIIETSNNGVSTHVPTHEL